MSLAQSGPENHIIHYYNICVIYIIQLHVSKVSKFNVVNCSKPIKQNITNKDV